LSERPKAAQELARHSTITLTQDYYTHLQLRDQVGALDMLPPPPPAEGKKDVAEDEKERRRA